MVMDEADGRTLSQNEIDAMLNASKPKSDPPPHAQAAPQAAPPPPAPEPQAAAPAPAPVAVPEAAAPAPVPAAVPQAAAPPAVAAAPGLDPAVAADLAQRLATVEAAMGRIDQLEASLAAVQATGGPKAQEFQAVVNQLKKVSGQAESMMQGLQNTPGYGTRKNFQCKSCGTQGMIVSLVRCSKCGTEKWLGWWPQR